jgi:pimeloyl-ACP methyl ester carboxylesterase
MLALVDREGPSGVARDMMPKLIGPTTRQADPTVESTIRRLIKQQSPDGIRAAIQRMMDRMDATPVLSAVRVPTLVIVGEEDALTPVDESRRLAAVIPGARLEIIPHAGHLPNLEQPDRFNAILTGFLEDLP